MYSEKCDSGNLPVFISNYIDIWLLQFNRNNYIFGDNAHYLEELLIKFSKSCKKINS